MAQATAVPKSKPAPRLNSFPPRRLQWVGDLLWLFRLVVWAAPGHCLTWIASAMGVSLLVPLNLWLLKNLVDALNEAAAGGPAQAVYPWLAAFVGELLLERLLSSLEPWLQVRFSEMLGQKLTQGVLEKVPHLPLAAFEHTGYYDELNRAMAGVEHRGQDVIRHTMAAVRQLPVSIGYAAVLATLSPVVLGVTLVGLLIVMVVSARAGQDVWNALRQQTFERRLSRYYFGLLTGRGYAKEIQLYGLKEYLLQRWTSLDWQARHAQQRAALKASLQQAAGAVPVIAAAAFSLHWIVRYPAMGATAGLYTIFFRSIFGLANTTYSFAGALRLLGEQSGYASDLRMFLRQPTVDAPPGALPFPVPLRSGIRFEDVTYTYPGSERPALHGVSFELKAGQKIALVGENGAGKSTLVRLLLGLYTPDAGRITVDGIDYRQLDPNSLYQATSAVLQDFVRYYLTMGENVALRAIETDEMRDAVGRAAARAGADTIAAQLENGYETLLGPDVGGVDLSVGQWQKVALARGFFRESAQILVLDEPTAALDPLAEVEVFELFRNLAADRTTVMVSHRLGITRLADRVLVLRDGRLIEDGTHEQLLQARGEYAALFEAQQRWYR